MGMGFCGLSVSGAMVSMDNSVNPANVDIISDFDFTISKKSLMADSDWLTGDFL